nr:dual specificity protein phosphatase family protein [Agarilytica rhodophyticola]
MPKPSSDWLKDDIRFLKNISVTKVISLLEKTEINELGLGDEEGICKQENLLFEKYPIKDRSVPNYKSFKTFIINSLSQIVEGENIAVHCRGGIGRAGLVACCILKQSGLSDCNAISLVSNSRGCSIPDTKEQLEFIKRYQ